MQKKLLCGFAALGLMAGNAMADFTIADFEGDPTAFDTYPMAYAYPNAFGTYCDFVDNGYGGPEIYETETAVLKNCNIVASSGAALAIDDEGAGTRSITECTGGFSFQYQSGTAVEFAVEMASINSSEAGHYVKSLPAKASLTGVTTVTLEDLASTWGTVPPFDLEDVNRLSWTLKTAGTGVNLTLDNVVCLTGGSVPPPPPPPPGSDYGYKVFAYGGKTATNAETAWGDYIMAYIFPKAADDKGPEPVISNPNDDYGILVFDEGVAKLKGVTFDPNNGTEPLYQGAFLGIKNASASSTKKISDCTEGLSYWYKGDAHQFVVEFNSSLCGTGGSDGSNKWGKKITTASTSSWRNETINLTTLPLANTWNGAKCTNTTVTSVDLSQVIQISWGFDDKQSGSNLMIADVVCLTPSGDPVATTQPDASIAITTGTIGGSTPVLNAPIYVGLTVVPFARGLQITSAKDATVSLFDANGKSVLTQKVAAGASTVSLEKQRQGLYYAVVQSGAAKQIVKVVVR